MDSHSFVCILEDGDRTTNLENASSLCQRTLNGGPVKPLTVLTDRIDGGAASSCVRRLFLHMYREHKLGGNKTMMYLCHDEHLVAVQLSLAEWNKQAKGIYEADIRSVLKASTAILAAKLQPCTTGTQPSSPPRRTQRAATAAATPKNCVASLSAQTPLAMNSPKTPGGISRLHQLRGSPRTPGVPPHHTPVITASPGVQLTDSPGTPAMKLNDEVVAELLILYNNFVRKCGKVDIVDIYRSVQEHFEKNENVRVLFLKEHLFLIGGIPNNACERAMLKYLVGDQAVFCLSQSGVPINGLSWEHIPSKDLYSSHVPISYLIRSQSLVEHLAVFTGPDVSENSSSVSERFIRKLIFSYIGLLVNSTGETSLARCLCLPDQGLSHEGFMHDPHACSTDGLESVNVRFIRKLFFSYISLLVNSTDEMSLACCLCLPDRGLSHEGFTALKHVAREKNMAMFLTAFSFVFDLRRVKRVSDSYAPLFAHSKALSEFVDIADKLLTITQDVPAVDQSAEKVLKALKTTFIKSKSCVLRPESVKKVFDQLISEVREATSGRRVDLNLTPKPVGCGGSMRGQKVIKLFRTMLDKEATDVSQNEGFEDLVDHESSQRTPVRLPSIFSQFRSPSARDQSSDLFTSENEEDHDTPEVTYTKTHYGWVGPSLLHRETPPVPRASTQGTSSHVPHQGNLAHPCEASKRPPLQEISEEAIDRNKDDRNADNRVDEQIIGDLEATTEVDAVKTTGSTKGRTTPVVTKPRKNKKQPLKRKKLELEGGTRARKKQRTEKKKNAPLQKGQKLLTNFFKNPKA